MHRLPVPAISILIVAAACGPAVSSGRFSEQPLPPTSGDIALYSTKLPACAYDEVGLVHVERRHGFTDLQKMLDALRERAREMGGHAVVGVALAPRVKGDITSDATSVTTDNGVNGTVVRFKDQSCRE